MKSLATTRFQLLGGLTAAMHAFSDIATVDWSTMFLQLIRMNAYLRTCELQGTQ